MWYSMSLYPFFSFFFISLHQLAYAVASLSSSAHTHLCSYEQSLALLQFKLSFAIDNESFASRHCHHYGQSSPKMMSWNSSTDCCRWDGVMCHALTGHLIGLDLSCSQLVGTLRSNSTLFQLPHLQRLNLAYNNFSHSQISPEFGRFASLTHLNLSSSSFYGQIPSEILHLSKLVSLDLSYTSLLTIGSHNFKVLLTNLTQLREVYLRGVSIDAVVPMNLSLSLTFLYLSGTGLFGKLPDKIFHLPNLQTLDLSGNRGITGYLPTINASSGNSLRRLDLTESSLHGQIPDSIGYLKSLNYLHLARCKFSGSIPESLGNLTRIINLDLSRNNFSGKIPFTLLNLENLTLLDFSTNDNLEGQIPNFFANFSHLRTLNLQDNNFSGPFPSSVTNLTQLVWLDLSSNSLTGPFPSTIVGFQKLISLVLSGNSLNGTIPSWLFSLPSLGYLDIYSNRLTGQIEDFQNKSLDQLSSIDLRNNELQGPIPLSILKLASLIHLFLSGNNFTGNVDLNMFSNHLNLRELDLSSNDLSVSIPTNNINETMPNLFVLGLSSCKLKEFPLFLRASKSLKYLDLSYNQIQGRLPIWVGSAPWYGFEYLNLSHNFITGVDQIPWGKLAVRDQNRSHSPTTFVAQIPWGNLAVLDLRSNLLQGPFPSSVCNFHNLEILDLSNNSLGGIIPSCLGNFSYQLRVLDLRINGFQGSIPTTFEKGNMLRSLNLDSNKLNGTIPRSLANCKLLQVLDFGNNQINDTFPQWLATLPELQILVLRSNRFHGPISNTSKTSRPFSKLRIIDLSHNEFSGLLPKKFFRNFKAMMSVGDNEMAWKYMEADSYRNIGLYIHCYDYMTLVMKGLPHELRRISTVLTTIDLSSNKFKGEIPNFIGNLNSLRLFNLSHNSLVGHIPSLLGNLSVLEALDLSSNQLVGEIPEQLASLTFLEYLNLSQNHLMGRIPRGNQFNTFENDSYSGNLALCGFPLSKNCVDNETPPLPLPPIFQQEDNPDFASGFTWKVVLMGYCCGMILGLVMGFLMFFTGKPKWFVGLVENKKTTQEAANASEERSHTLRKKKLTISDFEELDIRE